MFQPSPPTSQQTLLPAELCVEALVVAGGNVALAAERLFGVQPNATAYLMASIAQDPMASENLNSQLRTLTTLKTFDALNQVMLYLPTVMHEMEPAEFGRLFGDILKHMSTLTLSTQRQNDPADALQRLLNTLPPTARRALVTLISEPDATDDAALARLSGGYSESLTIPEGAESEADAA